MILLFIALALIALRVINQRPDAARRRKPIRRASCGTACAMTRT